MLNSRVYSQSKEIVALIHGGWRPRRVYCPSGSFLGLAERKILDEKKKQGQTSFRKGIRFFLLDARRLLRRFGAIYARWLLVTCVVTCVMTRILLVDWRGFFQIIQLSISLRGVYKQKKLSTLICNSFEWLPKCDFRLPSPFWYSRTKCPSSLSCMSGRKWAGWTNFAPVAAALHRRATRP